MASSNGNPPEPETHLSLQEEDTLRENEYAELKILERKFGSKLNYKSGCTVDTPVSRIRHEKKVILDLINSKCTSEMVYKGILGQTNVHCRWNSMEIKVEKS